MLAFSNDYYGMIFRATQSVELFCAYENKIEVRREEIQLEERKKSIGKRIRKYLFPSTDTKKFIGKYLENDKMTKEQKDYLLECLESGVGIKEMSEFAFENLTVEQMERLRKINEKRKE